MNQATRMGMLPAQKQQAASTEFQRRAVYFNSATAFMQKKPLVPSATFSDEAARALDPNTPTSIIDCDLSDKIDVPSPATTPNILTRYVVIRAGDRIDMSLESTTVAIYYVIHGSGQVTQNGMSFNWASGDIFRLPGGAAAQLAAGAQGALLWSIGNEPLLRLEGLRPPLPAQSPIKPVHYPAAEIDRQFDVIYQVGKEDDTAARALIFSADDSVASRNISLSLTLAYNTLEPGVTQRGHRHNSVAVSLTIQGKDCYSVIDGKRKDWLPWTVTITPPCAFHSHHNGGNERARVLVVQDGGVYTHARADGFSFD